MILFRLTRAIVPATTLLIVACSDSPIHDGPIVRDSAGITIVENQHSTPAWGIAGWKFTDRPILQIGAVDVEGPEQLYGVTQSRLLPTGDIVVVNSRIQEVRVFDEQGRYQRTVGRRGDGPGEFRSPWHAYPFLGDSVIVVDLYQSVSVFDDRGRYARSFVPGGVRGEQQGAPIGQFADGSLIFMRYQRPDPAWAGTVVRNQVELVRVDLEGNIATIFGLFDEQTGRLGGGPRYLFGPRGGFAAGPSSLFYGPGDRLELREISQDGQTLRLIRLNVPQRPVTPADKDSYLATLLERAREEGREAMFERLYAGADAASHFPAHSDIHVDSEGYIWVEEYQPLHVRETQKWFVFAPNGHYMGSVAVPAGFRIHQVTVDRVIGRWNDDFDVEFVRVYGIENRSSSD